MKKQLKQGFTLIEMMVVIVIISILASLLLAGVFGVGTAVDEVNTKLTLKNTRDAINNYKEATGVYPISDQVTGYSDTWVYDLMNRGATPPYIQDPGDEVQQDHDTLTGSIYDAFGEKIRFRVVGGSSNTGVGTMTIDDYVLASNKLNTFYVWSSGEDMTEGFEAAFQDKVGWDFDISDNKWVNYEHIEDNYWWDADIDDLVVSGHR